MLPGVGSGPGTCRVAGAPGQTNGDHDFEQWHQDTLSITDFGRKVLAGKMNFLELPVRERWVGGVRIHPGQQNWHWDSDSGNVVKQ